MPATPEDLFAALERAGIATATHRHAALFTVEQSKALRGALPGGHTKNLFLRDKKERHWLVTADEDRAVDLKALGEKLGAQGRLSFASPERLAAHLGVEPGAVTPFALLNDVAGRVTFVLDEGLLAHDTLNFHPLTNEATTAIGRADFLAFLASIGHRPLVMALPERARAAPAP